MGRPRTWFTAENTQMGPALTKADLGILNRAARRWADMSKGENKGAIRHIDLVILRTTYKSGMSVNDLLKASGVEL